MFLVSSCSCFCPIHWIQVLSRERRCSWSSADRRSSNYIWVINDLIAYLGVTYIRGFTVHASLGLSCTIDKNILSLDLPFQLPDSSGNGSLWCCRCETTHHPSLQTWGDPGGLRDGSHGGWRGHQGHDRLYKVIDTRCLSNILCGGI